MKHDRIGTFQFIVVVALGATSLWNLQRRDPGNVGLTARVQPGTCIGWVNTAPPDNGRPMTWPNWADTDFEVTAGTVSMGVLGSADDSGTVNLALFLTEASANQWKIAGGARALWRTTSSLQTLLIDSAERFSMRVLSHDYGGISISPGTTWASLGLSKTTNTQLSTMYVEVAGPAGSEFIVKYDQAERTGVFGDRPSFSFMSWPPQYPEPTRAWSAALKPGGLGSGNDCVRRVAPERRVELGAALGPLPNSALKEQAHARFTRAVKRVVVSGVTGTLSIDAGQGRTIGPEDVVDVSGQIAQLTVDTRAASLALVGNLTDLRVNNDDVRGRLIDGWPWYLQAGFWSLFGWAAVGVWHRRHELSAYARSMYRARR